MLQVKSLLKQKGITAKELSTKMGISEGALSLAINGNPTLETLTKIADALGVEIAELFASKTIICPKCGARFQIINQ